MMIYDVFTQIHNVNIKLSSLGAGPRPPIERAGLEHLQRPPFGVVCRTRTGRLNQKHLPAVPCPGEAELGDTH